MMPQLKISGKQKLTGESNGIIANCNANVTQTKSHAFTRVIVILIVNDKVVDDISKAGKEFKCQILKLGL